jgi:nitroreductase
MELDRVIRKRRMVRAYRDMPLPDKIVDKLIANALRAPSAGHTQVQEFIIVRDPNTKRRLRHASVDQEQVENAPALIIVCANTSRSVQRYGQRGRNFYSIIDGAFSSMLILLTAISEDIGASFVGAFEDDKVSEILGLPDYVRPVGIIAIGFANEKRQKLKRIDGDQLVHSEKW